MSDESPIHQNILEHLAKGVGKFYNSLFSFSFFRELPLNLKNFQSLYSGNKKTVRFGTETFTYRVPQIWNLIPENIRNSSSFETFKEKIGNADL